MDDGCDKSIAIASQSLAPSEKMYSHLQSSLVLLTSGSIRISMVDINF